MTTTRLEDIISQLAVARKDGETKKVRVTYDGSVKASKKERSMNDCLQTGPNHLLHIFNMMANFRKKIVARMGDIEKAFQMVGIQDDQQDFLQFLWFDNPTLENPNIIHLKFTRLVFGLHPSPAILGATIKHHLKLYKQSQPEMLQLPDKSFYVDDLLMGDSNEERTLVIYHHEKLMPKGGLISESGKPTH